MDRPNAYDTERLRDAIETLLDDYRGAVERRVRRSVDAVSCGTPTDQNNARKAAEAEDNERERVVNLLMSLAGDGQRAKVSA